MQSLLQNAELIVPPHAAGVVFMPGIGGMLHLPAIRHLANQFHDNGFGTLIADLLTPDEQELDLRTRGFRTDVPMLAARSQRTRSREKRCSFSGITCRSRRRRSTLRNSAA